MRTYRNRATGPKKCRCLQIFLIKCFTIKVQNPKYQTKFPGAQAGTSTFSNCSQCHLCLFKFNVVFLETYNTSLISTRLLFIIRYWISDMEMKRYVLINMNDFCGDCSGRPRKTHDTFNYIIFGLTKVNKAKNEKEEILIIKREGWQEDSNFGEALFSCQYII